MGLGSYTHGHSSRLLLVRCSAFERLAQLSESENGVEAC